LGVTASRLWLLGVALLALCLWVIFDPALIEVRNHLQLFAGYKIGLVVAIIGAVGVCLVSMLGFCVSWHRSSKGLAIYSVLCLLLILGQITVMAFVFKYTAADKLRPWLSQRIRDMIVRSKVQKEDAITFLDHVQERYSCCGGFRVEDYTENEMDLPWSCFFGEASVHEKGCGEVLVEHFKANGLAVGLIALTILFLQIILCVSAWAQFFDKRVIRPRLEASSV
ncbi:23 kDa integral membrane protein-like, partial [Tropilaelaps mercedesae]